MAKEQSIKLDDFVESSKSELEKKIVDLISDKKIASILAGGKRLRPLLANLSFKACTQGNETPRQYQKALEGAVIIELTSVSPFDPANEDAIAILAQIEAQQTQQLAQDLLAYFGAALVNTAQPTVNQVRIDSLHDQLNYSAN